MEITLLEQILKSHLPNCTITVSGDGHHFQALIVGSIFDGKNKLARHRLVYSAVVSYIASGQLHALSLKTYTPEEWKNIQHKE